VLTFFRRGVPWHVLLGILGAAACGLLIVGVLDVLNADRFTGRIVGTVLSLMAGLTLTVIRVAWADAAARWRSTAVAAGAMLLVSVATLVMTFPPRQLRLAVIAIGALLVTCTAVFTLLQALAVRRRAAPSSQGPAAVRGETITSVTTLVAALIAVPTAWYSGYYLPNQAAPTVTLESEIGEIEPYGTHASTTITIKATNTSDTSVRIIGSIYVLSGTTLSADNTPGPSLDAEKLAKATGDNYGPSARYNVTTTQSSPELIQFGQVVWDQATLVANESTTATVVAFLPISRYDVLRLGTDLVIARDDRLSTGDPITEAGFDRVRGPGADCAGRQTIVRTWPLQHDSLVAWLTQEDTEVVLGYVVDDPTYRSVWWPTQPYLEYQAQRVEHHCAHLFDEDTDGLERTNMVDMASAMTERLVPTTLAPATRGGP
jgi:hypothetical protein